MSLSTYHSFMRRPTYLRLRHLPMAERLVELGVVVREVGDEVRGLVRSQRTTVLAQVEGVEVVAPLHPVVGRRGLEEVVGEPVDVIARSSPQHVTIVVRDRGAGMPADVLARSSWSEECPVTVDELRERRGDPRSTHRLEVGLPRLGRRMKDGDRVRHQSGLKDTLELLAAFAQGKLHPVSRLNRGFVRPSSRSDR